MTLYYKGAKVSLHFAKGIAVKPPFLNLSFFNGGTTSANGSYYLLRLMILLGNAAHNYIMIYHNVQTEWKH